MTLLLKSLKCEEKRRMCGGEKHSFTFSLIVSGGNKDKASGLLTMAGDYVMSSRRAQANSQLANDMFMI